jgi:hypothetical protein
MSLPFFCNSKINADNSYTITIFQLMGNDDIKWKPANDLPKYESKKISLNNGSHFIIYDKIIIKEYKNGCVMYEKEGKQLIVNYIIDNHDITVGFCSNGSIIKDENNVQIKNVSVLVHLGNQININFIFNRYNLSMIDIATAESNMYDMYISYWNSINMNLFQHKMIPGKNDCSIDIHKDKDFKFTNMIIKMLDIIANYINGESRTDNSDYYCCSLNTDNMSIEIMSNWHYSNKRIIKAKIDDLTEDYLSEKKYDDKDKHLILAYSDNILNHNSFDGIMNLFNPITFTVIFGELTVPVSYKITNQNKSYEIHSAGTLDYVNDSYDILTSKLLRYGVCDKIMNYSNNFSTSYLTTSLKNDSIIINRLFNSKNIVTNIKENFILLYYNIIGM